STMSGIGTRAIENTPCVVSTTKPAARPTARSHNCAPIHHVASATPSAARSEGHTAVACVTAPVGHAASAISQASTGGLLRYGTKGRQVRRIGAGRRRQPGDHGAHEQRYDASRDAHDA